VSHLFLRRIWKINVELKKCKRKKKKKEGKRPLGKLYSCLDSLSIGSKCILYCHSTTNVSWSLIKYSEKIIFSTDDNFVALIAHALAAYTLLDHTNIFKLKTLNILPNTGQYFYTFLSKYCVKILRGALQGSLQNYHKFDNKKQNDSVGYCVLSFQIKIIIIPSSYFLFSKIISQI